MAEEEGSGLGPWLQGKGHWEPSAGATQRQGEVRALGRSGPGDHGTVQTTGPGPAGPQGSLRNEVQDL